MSNLSDAIGNATLYNGLSYTFTEDRFCCPRSSIYLNQGYLQVPPGVYFWGDLTIIAWIRMKSIQSNSRIIDFGNGPSMNNVLFTIYSTNFLPIGEIFSGSFKSSVQASSLIRLDQWYHVAFVLNGTTGFVYINGVQQVNKTLNQPKNMIRSSNYIGKSNSQDPNANAVYDDLKIYFGAMSAADILNDYNTSSNYS